MILSVTLEIIRRTEGQCSSQEVFQYLYVSIGLR